MKRSTRWIVAALAGATFVAGGFVAGLAAPGPAPASADTSQAERVVASERAAERADRVHRDRAFSVRGFSGLHDTSGVAKELGLDAEALLAAIRDGATIAEAAAAQGMERDDLVAGIIDLATEPLSNLPERAAERIAEHLPRIVERLVDASPRPRPGADRPGRGNAPRLDVPRFGGHLGAVADIIGIERRELLAALAAGATPAEVAADHGVDRDALVDALLERSRTRIEAWVDGK